jgi:hypothetical protein
LEPKPLAFGRDPAGAFPVRYVLRPVLDGVCSASAARDEDGRGAGDGAAGRCVYLGTELGPLPLPGFGVEMAIKNMEYSALDDSKVWILKP